MKRILIATDGSAHVLKAAQLAGKLAASMGAELHVLAVAYRDREGERWQDRGNARLHRWQKY
jgi:nucleotide-binding universal stress UspA family protein